MAIHDISSRFWAFAGTASFEIVRPQSDRSRIPLDAEPNGTDREADPHEPEWQGQWRLLKYV